MSGRPHQGHPCYPDCPSTREPRVEGKSRSVAGAQSAGLYVWSLVGAVSKEKSCCSEYQKCIPMLCIKPVFFLEGKKLNSKL